MASSSSQDERIRKTIKEIESLYEIGRKTARQDHKACYGKRSIETQANKPKINPDTLRKARVFADQEKGYSEDELRQLIASIRRHQTRQTEGQYIFGRSHLIRILSVPKKHIRAKLQEKAVQQGWSSNKLDAEIRKRFGIRRAGGRRPVIPEDTKGLLCDLELLCDRWHRWHESFQKKEKTREYRDLPGSIRKKLGQISLEVKNLQVDVATTLKKLAGTWPPRPARGAP